MNLGELLGRFFDFLWEFWPVRIVSEWEQGVRVYQGRTTRLLGPGLHWFVPMLGEICVRDCNIEVIETALQTVRTADGYEATFALAVKLRIRNLRKSYQKIHSATETVRNEVMGRSAWACAQLDFDDLRESLGSDTLTLVRDRLAGWGIDIQEVSATTLTRARAVRLIFDGPTSWTDEE